MISVDKIKEKLEVINEVLKEIDNAEMEIEFKDRLELVDDKNYKKIITSMMNEEKFYLSVSENYGMKWGYEMCLEYHNQEVKLRRNMLKIMDNGEAVQEQIQLIDTFLRDLISPDERFKVLKESTDFVSVVKSIYMLRYCNLRELSKISGILKSVAYCNEQFDEFKTL